MQIISGSHFYFFLFFAFIIGASIGSFLNVCILRIPKKKSLSIPGSHCFQCGTALGLGENIPIIGYFILKGKCKHCGSTFSFQYAWVEIITAIFSMLFFILAINDEHSFDPYAWALKLTLFSVLIVASLIDLKWEIIPDQITIPVAVLFIAAHFFVPNSFPHSTFNNTNFWSNPNFIIALLLIYLLYFIFSHVEQTRNKINIINLIFLLLLIISFVILMITKTNKEYSAVIYSLMGAIFTGGILYIIALPSKIINAQEFLGEGDIKLFLVIGAFMGGLESYKILMIWLYLASTFASILIFTQVIKKNINPTEKRVGGVFLFLMICGILLVSYVQVINFNRMIFLIAVSLFLSSSFCYFFLAKKWSDSKLVSKGFPMAPFIALAGLLYLFYIENFSLKINIISQWF